MCVLIFIFIGAYIHKLLYRIPFGSLFEKGLTLGTGQCDVKSYNRYLRDLIISGRAKPSFVISHEIGIEDAPAAYKKVCTFHKQVHFQQFWGAHSFSSSIIV